MQVAKFDRQLEPFLGGLLETRTLPSEEAPTLAFQVSAVDITDKGSAPRSYRFQAGVCGPVDHGDSRGREGRNARRVKHVWRLGREETP